MKRISWNFILGILVVVIVIFCLLWADNKEFGGTDNAAVDVITSDNYVPWFDYIIAPSSSVIESLLFSLQSAIGAGVLFYFIGYFRGRKSTLDGNGRREK